MMDHTNPPVTVEQAEETLRLLAQVREPDGLQDRIHARLAALSGRERQVLEGLVAGYPNKTIAFDLGISARTVEVHRANIKKKLNLKTAPDLVRQAVRWFDSKNKP